MQLFGQLLVTAIINTATYGLVTLGFALFFAVSRVFHFAHAGLVLVPGYVYLSLQDAVGPLPAALGGLVAGAVAGVVVQDGVYAPLQRRRANSRTLLVASLGTMTLLEGLVGAIWGSSPRYLESPLSDRVFDLGGITFGVVDIVLVVVAVLAIGGTLFWTRWSRTGRSLLAVAEEPDVAVTVGISAPRAMRIAAAIGTALGGLGIIYLGIRSGVTPELGATPLLFAFAGAIVGGLGRIGGSVLGLAVLVVVSTVATHWVATFWTVPIAFIVLVFFLLGRPQGLLGLPKRSTAI